MKFNALNQRMAALEERAKPRMIATLADFVLWRAKWRQGIMEEVEIDPVLEEALRRFSEQSHGGENLEA
jgi:hypothetical protein